LTNTKKKRHHHRHSQYIAVTQPMRVAAMTVAQCVTQEQGCVLGTKVGYLVRFVNCSNIRTTTKLFCLTDGMLSCYEKQMLDPLLCRYAVVVLDEAHERSLQTGIVFRVVKRAVKARDAITTRTAKQSLHDNNLHTNNNSNNNNNNNNNCDQT
jgi:HrpA-like RNA helicase